MAGPVYYSMHRCSIWTWNAKSFFLSSEKVRPAQKGWCISWSVYVLLRGLASKAALSVARPSRVLHVPLPREEGIQMR